MRRSFLIIVSIIFFSQALSAQELPITTQVFLNPYFYNPAFAGFENRPAVTVGSRQQWSGIEGAPQSLYFNFHTAFGDKIPFGINIYSDTRGVLSTVYSLLSVGYRARFDENDHYLSFALSGGAGFNNVDIDFSSNGLANDPAITAALNNRTFLDGNAGLLYHNNGFNLSLSLPKLFVTGITDTANAGSSSLEIGDLNPLNAGIAMVSYKWRLSEDGLALDPWLMYHYNQFTTGQFEANARLIIKNFMWLGGGYRMDYGASAFFGINIKDNFKFGYAYELGSADLKGLNAASHEFQLSVIFGKSEQKKRKGSFYERRRQMLNTMRGNTQPAAAQNQNQSLYKVQNDPFANKETPAETPKEIPKETPQPAPVDDGKVDLDKFMEGYKDKDTVKQESVKKPEPVKPAKDPEKSVLSSFEAPKKDEVTTRDEKGIYIGPKVVKKGDHLLELDKGYYVIVGTFNSYRDAEEYSDKLFMQGFYTKFGYISQTTDYYVYIFFSEDNHQECVDTIDRFKQITTVFRDMWVLTVE